MKKLLSFPLFSSFAFLSSLPGQTSNQTQVSVTDWNAGTPSTITSTSSSTGANLTTGLQNSGFGNADGVANSIVDTTTNASGDPILRSLSRTTATAGFNDIAYSHDAISVAESFTIFRAGSTVNPVGTSFSASFDFLVEGVFTFDMGGGGAVPNWSTFNGNDYFAPGDQARMSFTLGIRPVDDAIAEVTPNQGIDYGTEILWNSDGFQQAQSLDILDSLTFSKVGDATEEVVPNGNQVTYQIEGSVPFSSVVGRDYQVYMRLQTDAAVRGSSGFAKVVEADFFNSASAQPISGDGINGFTVVPEPTAYGLILALFGFGTAVCRRRR